MTHLSPNFDTSNTAEPPIQQNLEELGITQLLGLLKHYSDIDFDAAQMHLTDAEVHAIAALFIQQLTESLNGKLIAGALNTLRHSEEMEDITQEDGRVLPPSWVKQFLFVPKPAPTHLNLNHSPREDEENLYCYPTHSCPHRLNHATFPLSKLAVALHLVDTKNRIAPIFELMVAFLASLTVPLLVPAVGLNANILCAGLPHHRYSVVALFLGKRLGALVVQESVIPAEFPLVLEAFVRIL